MAAIKHLRYVPEDDACYLSGDLSDNSTRQFSAVGRFDAWSRLFAGEQPRHAWTRGVPYDRGWDKSDGKLVPGPGHSFGLLPESLDVAGDYYFVSYRRYGTTDPEATPEEVLIFRIADGHLVDVLRPGADVGHWVGDTEMSHSMTAFQLDDGRYVIFEEANDYAKIIYWVWTPPAD